MNKMSEGTEKTSVGMEQDESVAGPSRVADEDQHVSLQMEEIQIDPMMSTPRTASKERNLEEEMSTPMAYITIVSRMSQRRKQ